MQGKDIALVFFNITLLIKPNTCKPGTEPIASKLPPTPSVKVNSNHWPIVNSGCMFNTANIKVPLSMKADDKPIRILATAGSIWPNK